MAIREFITESDGGRSGGGDCKLVSSPAPESEENSGEFNCNICLDIVKEPVLTLCGHLYCWPCLYKWLQLYTISEDASLSHKQCPVCKADVSPASVIPIYGSGETKVMAAAAAGSRIPQRPATPASLNHHRRRRDNIHRPAEPAPGNAHLHPFAGVLFAGVFANSISNAYTQSYHLAGSDSLRLRRQLMLANKSLSRISFFLTCCTICCFLLF